MKTIVEEKYNELINDETIKEINDILYFEMEKINYENMVENTSNPVVPVDPVYCLELSALLVEYFKKEKGETITYNLELLKEFYISFWLFERQFKTILFNRQMINVEAYFRKLSWEVSNYFDLREWKKQYKEIFNNGNHRTLIKRFISNGPFNTLPHAPYGLNYEEIKYLINSSDRQGELRNYTSHPKSIVEYINEYRLSLMKEKGFKVIALLYMNAKPMKEILLSSIEKIYKENTSFNHKEEIINFINFTIKKIQEICLEEKLDSKTTKQKIDGGQEIKLFTNHIS